MTKTPLADALALHCNEWREGYRPKDAQASLRALIPQVAELERAAGQLDLSMPRLTVEEANAEIAAMLAEQDK